jgi:nitrogen-specific signal transduction histidine kinase
VQLSLPRVVLIPLLAVLGLASFAFLRDRDLGKERSDRERRNSVDQIRRVFLDSLPRDGHGIPKAVTFVGTIREGRGRPVAPWEERNARSELTTIIRDPSLARTIQELETAEHGGEPTPDLVRRYDNGSMLAVEAEHRAYIEYRRGRMLVMRGQKEPAKQAFEKCFKEARGLVDAKGIQFEVHAIEQLVNLDPHDPRICALLQRFPFWDYSGSPTSPTSVSYLRGVMARVPGAAGIRSSLDSKLRWFTRIEQLQRDFPWILQQFASGDQAWVPYGDPLWLVTVSPRMKPTRVVAADPMRVNLPHLAFPRGTTVSTNSDGGYAVGPSVPGVYMHFPYEYDSPVSVFSVLAFISIVLLTGISAYLLVRDSHRRAALADLRSQFVANVSHELKTPLAAIRMYAETLALHRAAPEAYPRYLNTIVAESERLSRLVDTVLDFSKAERGQIVYRLTPVSLEQIVTSACSLLHNAFRAGGFRVRQQLEHVPHVMADADAVQRGVVNLLTNAIKYSGESRDITVRLTSDSKYAIIEVTDLGVGIAPEHHRRIFDSFFRVPSPDGPAVAGAGLGLTLVDHMARGHGGHVRVQSAIGQGSTFWLCIPLLQTNEPNTCN